MFSIHQLHVECYSWEKDRTSSGRFLDFCDPNVLTYLDIGSLQINLQIVFKFKKLEALTLRTINKTRDILAVFDNLPALVRLGITFGWTSTDPLPAGFLFDNRGCWITKGDMLSTKPTFSITECREQNAIMMRDMGQQIISLMHEA
jgi:hypothetical protein